MGFVCDSNGGLSPGVLYFGIQCDVVRFQGQRGGVTENHHGAGEIFTQRPLEACTPAWCIRRHSTEREIYGKNVQAGVHTASAIETTIWVGIIEIVQNARCLDALIFIQRMLERSHCDWTRIEHEEFADQTAGIGQTLWKEV